MVIVHKIMLRSKQKIKIKHPKGQPRARARGGGALDRLRGQGGQVRALAWPGFKTPLDESGRIERRPEEGFFLGALHNLYYADTGQLPEGSRSDSFSIHCGN